MSKILNVSILDKNTLVLEEDAKKGDKIDLLSLNKVDLSNVEKLIVDGVDSLYNKKLKEQEELLILSNKEKIENVKLSVKNEYIEEITRLKSELNIQKELLDKEYNIKIKELEDEIKLLNDKQNLEIEKVKLEVSKNMQEVIDAKDKEISNLTLSKSNISVKRIGERLEHWCANEYEEHSMNGFINCTFEKDNLSIKEDGDVKGTKADYIFKVFSNESLSQELTSVVCEMKSEDPTSVNKKKNSDHYKKLDGDRNKKKCEYALLVSELEWNDVNDVPIRKVKEYDKMYVVRPQYFITFLNIISSLAGKYQSILLEKEKEREVFKETDEILNLFDKLREEIVDKQLGKLNKEIEDIKKQCEAIKPAADKISASTSKVTDTIIRDIQKKIENFNITKITKKIEKLD